MVEALDQPRLLVHTATHFKRYWGEAEANAANELNYVDVKLYSSHRQHNTLVQNTKNIVA
jgi:hypothetical protein